MELYIAEKPSVGRTIASVIGANERRDGYWEGNGRLVSWCIGHLVALAIPEAYRSDYQRWRYSDLPILPDKWQYTVVAETKKQFELLRRLFWAVGIDGNGLFIVSCERYIILFQ